MKDTETQPLERATTDRKAYSKMKIEKVLLVLDEAILLAGCKTEGTVVALNDINCGTLLSEPCELAGS